MANDINTVTLTGRLVKDAELRQTKNGTSVSTFTIGNTQSRKNASGQWEPTSHYFKIVLWGRQGEALKPYLLKGAMIAVTGRLEQRSYKPANEEKLRYEIEVISENLRLMPSGNRGQGGGSSGGGNTSRPNESSGARSYDNSGAQGAAHSDMPEPGYPENGPSDHGPMDDMAGGAIPDDDIPF